MRSFLLFIIFPLVFLALSTRWMSWESGHELLQTSDVTGGYEQISAYAPDFPPESLGIPYHKMQRMPVPYLIGVVAKLFVIDFRWLYRIAGLFCLIIITLLLHASFRDIWPFGGLLLAIFLLNPYAVRYYLMAPGMLPDLIFHLGLCWLLYSLLITKNHITLVFAALLCLVGRQTATLFVPFFAGFAFYLWRKKPLDRPNGPLIISLAICTALVPLIYSCMGQIVAAHAPPSGNLEVLLGSIKFFLSPSFSLTLWCEYLARLFLPIAIPFCLSVAFLMRDRGYVWREDFWIPAILGFLILLQPLLAGPDITGGNATRLSALGLLPFLYVIRVQVKNLSLSTPVTILALVLIAAGSLHHIFSVLGPASSSQFALLHLTVSSALGLLVGLCTRTHS